MKNIDVTPYAQIKDLNFLQETKISIKNISFQGAHVDNTRITFSIIGCKFRKVYFENLEEIDFENISISFVACFFEDIEIEDIKSKNISVSFFSCIITGLIKSEKLNFVKINNCICRSLFLINLEKLIISYTEENIFPKYWKKLFKEIGSDFLSIIKENQSFYISDTKTISFNTNEMVKEKSGLYRRNHETYINHKIGYYLSKQEKELFDINLSIDFSKPIPGQKIVVLGSFLNSLSLSGASVGSITIENTKINNWYISNFSSNAEVSFYNIHPIVFNVESKIGIHKSNLDEAWFDNVDFDKYQRISLYRTKLAKSIFTSCNFPSKYSSFERFMPIENVHYPERKTQNHHKDQYEIFLQLKKSLEATGNYFEAQKLQAISHDALKNIVSISNGDKIILKINSLSNNHGLSIKKPFVGFLIFSILMYILYLFSLGRIFNSNEVDYNLIGYYFSFIDLTHRNDFLVNKEKFNAFSLTIDYLGKLMVGFFIYQFIASFRKYGKK